MSCGCGDCISSPVICVPRGDARLLVFSVLDHDGDEVDISSAVEIEFIVSDGNIVGGNIVPGGGVRISKSLTGGTISVSTNLYQFYTQITTADTSAIEMGRNYYEARITFSGGRGYTVAAGSFVSPETMIKDI